MTAPMTVALGLWIVGFLWTQTRRRMRLMDGNRPVLAFRYLAGSLMGCIVGTLGFTLATSFLPVEVSAMAPVGAAFGAVVFGTLMARDGVWPTLRYLFGRN